jgi:hypothetical protein
MCPTITGLWTGSIAEILLPLRVVLTIVAATLQIYLFFDNLRLEAESVALCPLVGGQFGGSNG